MSLNEIGDAVLRAFAIALLICVFVQRGRFPIRFTLSFGGALLGCVVTTFWSHL